MIIKDRLEVKGALEKHFSVHGARPSETREYMGHTVYLAEGGPHEDAKYVKLPPEDEWMNDGYYLAVWGVLVRNQMTQSDSVWGRPCYFKRNHDSDQTSQGRRDARLNAAMADAEDYILTAIRSGLIKNLSSLDLPPLGVN